MSNFGQTVLSVVGAAVGFIYGGPVGAQWGFALGGLAGSYAFPTKLPTIKGPKLDDLSVTVSGIGVPVPIVYGAFRISGNIIWSTDLLETTVTEKHGKGGPSQKTQVTTYSANFAVGLCEGPITGVRRIWAGGKLIYDRREQLPDETTEQFTNRIAAANSFDNTATLYLGTEDQLADPLMESYEGLGNVPGYRGLAYYVFEEFQLADYGNSVMSTALSFEVIVAGSVDFAEITEYAPPYIAPWLTSVDNPFNLDNDHSLYAVISRYDADGSPHVFLATTPADVTAAQALSDLANKTDVSSPNGNPLAPNWPGFFALCAYADKNNIYSTTNSTTRFSAGGYDDLDNAFRVTTFFFPLSEGQISPHFYEEASLVGGSLAAKLASTGANPGEAVYLEYPGSGLAGDGPPPCSLYYNAGTGTLGLDPVWNWDNGTHPGSPSIEYDGTNFWYGLEPIAVTAVRIPRKPSGKCEPRVPPNVDPPDAPFPGFCDIDGLYYEEGVDWEDQFDEENVALLQNYNTRVDYRQQVGPMLHNDDPNYAIQAYWEARYSEAVAAGSMPPGLTYDGSFTGDYPVNLDDSFTAPQAYYRLISDQSTLSTDFIRLFNIVEDLCDRSGLEADQYDAHTLTQIVDGYAIGRAMDAAGAIEPLRLYGFFDMVESDGVLVFPLRGRETVADVAEEDLAAHESDSERPFAVQVTRVQDVELPRVVRVKYAMRDKDYEPGEQYASRLLTTADQIIDLEIPVSMSDALAAQLADVNLYEAWWNRNQYVLSLSQKHMLLEPTDSINIPVDGALQRVRITSEDFSIPGIKQIRAVRDGTAEGVYTSYVAGDGINNTPLVPGGEVAIRDTTSAQYLNLPMLRDTDNDAGYYAALRQEDEDGFWPGAFVLRSPDGGISYDTVAVSGRQAVTGVITEISDYLDNTYAYLPPGDVEIINYTFFITVELDRAASSLSPATFDGILAGFNAAAVGDDGRWEIIQFIDAELLPTTSGKTWKIGGLTRGRRSTDSVMNDILGVVGDKFIVIDNAVRVTQNLANIGLSLNHKGVTSGSDANAVSPSVFATSGQSLKPFSPVSIEGERDGGDNITITWLRRSRFGQELPFSGGDIPLGEASEEYELDIIDVDEVTVLRTITGLTSPSYVYSSADQTTDFGSPQSAIFVDVYQISATVGRGYHGRGRNV